jgi:general secretion pathway protein I
MKRSRGFTLVEVMVALAVVAIALPALLFSLDQHIDGTAHVRDKSLAHMVAANKLTEIRLLARARESLLQGKDSGVATMADRDWYWWVDSQATEVDQFYRVEISVAAEEERQDQPLYTLSAFLSADLRVEEAEVGDEDGELGVGSGSGNSSTPGAQPGGDAQPGTGAGNRAGGGDAPTG